MSELDRREFLEIAGSGIFVFISAMFLPQTAPAQEPTRLPLRLEYPKDWSAYLRVGADGRVTCFVGKVEMGQGAMTALPQLVAEELDVPLSSVEIVMGDTELCPWDIGTFGSLTIRQFGPVLRAAAAEARAVLLELASERLEAPAERLQVQEGVVFDTARPQNKVTYSELAGGRRVERSIKVAPEPRKAGFKVIGTSAPRRDALAKVTGAAEYAGDMRLPGMMHARILRPPAHGLKLKSVETSGAESIPGVRVVREGEMVAVLHERPDLADKALGLVKARFQGPTMAVDDTTIFDHIETHAPEARLVAQSGDLEEGKRKASQVFTERYLNSYVAHAPIETHSALAKIQDGRVTVWASTQAPFIVRTQVAQALGLEPSKVRVITPFVGGGFGGKTMAPQAVEAARLARIIGRPVQVVWDRAEEFFFDTFRPASVVKIRSGLTKENEIAFWDYEVICAGDREAKQFYDVEHQRTVARGGWQGSQPEGLHPFGVGPWRAPSVNTNTFARESHIDIMASKAGIDPLEFRLSHLSDRRMVRVLKAAAQAFGWVPGSAPSGRGVGVACALYLGTYVATMAELQVEKPSGRVKVKRVVCAQDMGLVVNPEGARQQMEGCITMGLGYALSEEVKFKGGQVLTKNFDSYEIPRFSWLPKIETVIVEAPEEPAQGCGEPPIVCMGAVLANAIFDQTGARVKQLPMTPERIKRAMAKT
ncbi:MAG: molybdopterin cofactor-binding domain-containing protein [bacterium]